MPVGFVGPIVFCIGITIITADSESLSFGVTRSASARVYTHPTTRRFSLSRDYAVRNFLKFQTFSSEFSKF